MRCAERPATRPRHRRGRDAVAGFTLVEVLVALAIVGLALAALAGVFSDSLRAHETASGAEAALALAEERLAMAAAAPHPGAASGTFADRFAWRTSVTPYDASADENADKAAAAPPSLPRLYRVAVGVAWHDGRRAREVTLSTLRLGAAPGTADDPAR